MDGSTVRTTTHATPSSSFVREGTTAKVLISRAAALEEPTRRPTKQTGQSRCEPASTGLMATTFKRVGYAVATEIRRLAVVSSKGAGQPAVTFGYSILNTYVVVTTVDNGPTLGIQTVYLVAIACYVVSGPTTMHLQSII